MTRFNPENKDTLTYIEALEPAMNITDQADADQYLAAYIAYQTKMLPNGKNDDGLTAEDICKQNLGYYAGYYTAETRERVERLFKCKHPIFGSIMENGQPTVTEAFFIGQELGRRK